MKLLFLNCAKISVRAILCTLFLTLTGMLAATSASAQTVLYAEGTDMANTGDGVTYNITTPGTYRWTGTLTTPDDFQDRFSINLGGSVQISSASYTISGPGGFNGLYGFYANSAGISGNGSAAMSSGIGFPMLPIGSGPFYNNIFIGASFSAGNTWIIDVVVTTYCTPPTVAIGMSPSGTLCSGSSKTLTASGATTYTWAPATGLSTTIGATVTASPTSTTTYTVIGTTGSCTNTATRTVTLTNPPVITSVSSLVGIPGNTRTITGTGFNGTNANNIVFFGATRANVTGSTTTSLTATVPVGATYKEISLNNQNCGLTGYAQYPFLPTYNNSAFASGKVNFAVKQDFTAGSNPTKVVIGDIDGDGKADLVVANHSDNTVSVYRNTSSSGSMTSGSFAAQVTFATGIAPNSVAIGDLDGDGKPDLVVSNFTSSTVSVLRNTSSSGSITSGSFATQVTFATGTSPNSVAIGDIDGDGKPDLAVANYYSNNVSVLRNTSSSGSITSGSFDSQVTFATGTLATSVAIGDIDGDGKPDLAVANASSNNVSVLRNTSTSGSITSGSFATQVTFATGNGPYNVTIGDIDGDGKPDLAVANQTSNNVSILRNTSSSGSITSGSFDSQVTFATGAQPVSIAISDIDGDTKPDLVVANYVSSNVSVLRNTSSSGSITSGSFAAQVTFATGNLPFSVAIGDLDGDAKPDLVTGNFGSNNVSVLRNNPLSPITGTLSACPGSATTLSNATTGGTWSSSNTGIATVGSTTGVVTGVAPGTATITYAGTAGASFALNRVTAIVTVNALPTVSTSVSVTGPICMGSSKTITASGATTYTWAPATGLSATTGVTVTVSPTATTTYTVTGTDANGCADQATRGVTVIAVPTVTASASPSGAICRGDATTLTAAGAVTYIWAPSTGLSATTGASVTASPTTTVTYTITGTAANGCTDQVTHQVSVNAVPTVTNTMTPAGALCMGSSKTITASGAVSYSWAPATGLSATTGSSVTATPYSTTTYTITGTNAAGCTDASTRTITVTNPPEITSVSTLVGIPGTTVALTGTGFNNTEANNIVYFGATRATVTAATTTSLTATIPVGATYKEISLNNQNCDLTGYAQYPFLPTYNNSAFAAGTVNFETRIDSFTGAAPYCVTIGDIDGDGKADMAVANSNSASVSVFRNTGSSGTVAFASKVDFTAGTSPRNITIGDLDGDGKPDMVVVNYVSNTISVFRNTSTSGTVSFDTRVDLAAGVAPRTVAIGDLDGDGRADIAVTNGNSANFYAYRNTGASGTVSFASPVSFATGSQPYGIAIGDIDGNGMPDVVVSNHSIHTLSVFRNTGTAGAINFAAGVTWSTGGFPTIVRIGDIDGNGVPDIAVSNYASSSISVFRNLSTSGTISLAGHVTFATQTNPLSVAIGDLDGDGKLDMVGANDEGDRVSVLRNTSTSGTVSFASRVDFASNNAPFSVEIGDLDGDNKPDIAVANQQANRVSVLRNDPLSPVTGTVTTCVGGTTTLANVTTGGTWSSSTTAVASVGSLTGVVTGVATGTAVITYAGTAISGFTGNYVTTTVTIGALPTISAGAGVAICRGSSTTLTATGGTTYTWSPNTALSATTGASVTASPTTTVTYTVTGTNASGCSNTATKTVTVNPLPTISAGTGVAICRGSSTSITATGGTTYTWAPNTALSATTGASVTASPTTTVTYTVTGTDANGCVNTATKVVTVNVVPTVTTTMTPTGNLCLGSSKTLTAGGATTYTWAPATGLSATTGASVTASPTATTTYTVTGTTSGCSDDATRTITVTNPPEITSVSTLVGIPGTTVALTGTGFNNTEANNIVYFGATRATVTAATTTSLTATVPVGATYKEISLNNQNCQLTGYSQYPFLPTYDNSPFIPGTVNMNGKVDFTGSDPISVAIGDLDGDGKPDLVVANYSSNTVSVFRNTSSSGAVTAGSFAAKVDFTTDLNPCSVAIGDLDGDGKADLAVANNFSSTVSVFRNTSSSGAITSGSFAARVDFTTGTSPRSVAIGDLDGDGKADLTVTNQVSSTVSVFRNTSSSGTITSGSFAVRVDFTTGDQPSSVAIGDLDGDGKADLAVANFVSATVSVFRNTSSSGAITAASFAARVDFHTGWNPISVAIGDLDGDGKADLAVANKGFSTVSVFRNTSSSGAITSGSFAASVDFPTGMSPISVAIGDLDGDSKADLVVANSGLNSVSVYRNTSSSGSITTGSFDTQVTFATGTTPYSVAIGDIDGDDKPDLATANYNSDNVSVLRNNPLSPITGTLSACAGSTTTLSNATTGGTWSSSSTAIATVGSTTGVVTGVAAGTVTITYAGTAGASFALNRVTATVTVNALPTVSTSVSVTGPICMGSSKTITASGATTYTWAPATGLSATTGVTVTVSPTATTTYTVTGTDANGCTDQATRGVTVIAVPTVTASASPSGAICRGSSTVVTAAGAVSYTWSPLTALSATTGTSVTASPTTTVTYTITGTAANGCTDQVTHQVSVNAVPTVTNTMTPTGALCMGSSKTITASGAVSYSWAPATGLSATTGSSVTATPYSTTTYTITGTNAAGCSDDATRTITITNPPDITSVSTLVGIPGTAVSLTGTGFNTTLANNIVYFGATRATVTAATTTSLTATIPVGATYKEISLNNQNCDLVGYSQYPFLPTYNNSPFIPGTVNMDGKVDFTTGTGPVSVAIGDLDGDGKADLAVANYNSNTVSVYRNTSSSGAITAASFAASVDFTTGTNPRSVAIGDLDGDGKADLAVANESSATVSVFRNTGSSGAITSGSFAARVNFTTGSGPVSVAIGDLDGDGKADLAVANLSSYTVSVFRNTGSSGAITSGSFAASVDFTTGTQPSSVAIGDLDGDGKADLAMANYGSTSVSVFRNTSSSGAITSGSFAARVNFTTGTNPRSVAIGDLDGDGKADLAVANQGSATVSVFHNTSSSGAITSGSFAARVDFATGSAPRSVAIGDLDGDGKADLAVANFGSNAVSVFRNTSSSGAITSGSFAASVDFTTGTQPSSVAIGDLDGDGKADLATANWGSNTVSVIRNNPLSPITGTQSVCISATTTLSNATTGGTWSSSNTAIATVGSTTGVVTGVAAGTVTITYAGTAGASFAGNRVTAIVTVNALPTISAGANVAICRGSNTTLTATGGTTYTWSPNTALSATTGASVTASPTTTVTYTVTGTSGCSNTATKTVTVNALPTISAGAGVAICRGTSTTLTATGGTTYTWAPNTALSATTGASVTASPTTTVTYTVTGTDGNGCVNTATKVVTVNAVPTITPGSAATICSGATAALSASGASTYTWSPAADLSASTGANVTASPTITTTYTVTGTNTLGCSNTATQLVTVNELPDAFTGSMILCVGSTSTLSSAPGGGVWTSSNNAIATVGTSSGLVSGIAAGTSSITYTLGTGCRRKVTVTVNAAPTISAGTGVAICSGNSTSLTATGGLTYSWSPATALSATTGASVTASPTTTVTYTVTGTNANGCVNTATKTVTVNALPTISAGTQLNLCIGQSSAISATGGTTYTWSPGTGLSATTGASVTASPTTTVTYTVTGTNANGCTNFATKLVSVNPLPTVSAGANVAICRGSSTTLSATGTGSTYTWGPNIGLSAIAGASVTASPTVTITYTVTAMHSNGCTNLATKTVSVNALPTITAGAGVAICQGSSTAMTASGGTTYTWSPNTALSATTGASVTASPTTTVTYTVSGTDANGCINTATNTVTVNAIPIVTFSMTPTGDLCMGSSKTFTASGATTYTWAPATGLSATTGATVTATPYSSTTYTVTGATSGCGSDASNSVTIINPPVVTSISPLLGIPGASVAISGTGFNNSDANNIVYFGATRATVTGSSSSSLTATVPAGASYSEVTLNNQDCGLAGYSQHPFMPEYDNSGYAPATVNFSTRTNFTAGQSTGSVAIGDIDGDGKPDLAVTNAGSNTISVYRNTSSAGSIASGSFSAQVTFTTGTDPRGIAIEDLDGDGKPDLAVTNGGSNTISVYRNTSSTGSITSGSFATQVTFATGSVPTSVAIGDIDGDGKPDLAVANSGSNTVSVYRNTSSSGSITSGSFAAQVTFATGTQPRSVAIGDVDGDGKPDLAVTNAGSNTVSVYHNTSSTGSIASGSFATHVTFPTGTAPRIIAIGDIDGDSKPDLAVANNSSNTVSVLRNTGSTGAITSGSFAAQVAFATGGSTTGVAIADIDGDGKPDLAVANFSSSTVSVLRSTASSGTISSGSFAARVTFGTALQPQGLAIGDLDGDGLPDLVTGNFGSDNVSVFRNNPLSPIAGTPEACIGSITTLTNATTGGTWSSSNAAVATVGSATGIVTGVSSGTVTITYAGIAGASFAGNRVTTTVTINSAPTITAGANVAICTGSSTSLTASGATTYTWSPSTGLSATTGASVTASPITTVTYTVTGSNGCVGIATKTVSVNVLPTITAGADVAMCSGNSTTMTASGGVTYTWSPGTDLSATTGASVTASPTATVTYTVTGTNANGCVNTATKAVTVNASPTIVAGADATICRGASTALTASGGTTYTWAPNTALSATTGASVTASPTTTVTYTVTGTNGCVGTATQTVSVNPLPTIGAGATVTICRNSSATLTATGGATYTWSPATALDATTGTSVTASPTTTVTYTVTGTDANGCSNTATKMVSVNALPTITAGADVAICSGNSTTMTASGGVTYTWAPGTALTATTGASVTASPTTTVTYTVSGTNANGCINTATKTVTVNASPTIVAGANATICRGASTALTASGGTTYTWAPNTALSATTGASVTASPTTTVTYTVTGTNGCVGTATQTVSVNPLPTIGAGATVTICRNSSATLTATGGATYTWSPATALDATTGTSVTASPTTTVTYTVTGTDANGCINTATKMVSVNALPTITAGADVAICTGNSTTMTASGGVTYTWAPGTALTATTGASVTASPTATVTYTVTGTNANGCVNTATKTVTVNASPTIVAGVDATICRGASTALTASGGTTYTWAPNTALSATTGASVTASPTTTVTYTVTGTNGCVGTATQTVSVNPLPTIGAGAGVAMCNGASTTLNATGGDTYLWSPGTSLSATTGSSVVATPTITTTYTVSGTDANGCENTATKTVSVNASPTISAGTDEAICLGTSTVLTATGGTTYTWTPAAGLSATTGASVTASPTTTTTYTVTGTIAGGCNSTATKTVTVNALPTISAGSDVAICQGTGTTLSATGGTTYTWSPNTALSATTGSSITASPTTTVTYTVTGTDANGCNNAASKQVSVNALPTINAGSGVVICTGASTTLSATGGATYIWAPGASLTATTGSSVTASPTTTVTYTVTGTDGNGCTNTATSIVTVDVTPDAGTISGEDLVSIGAATALSSTQVGGTWSAGNGNATVGSTTGIVTGVSGGTVVISYTYTNACGTDYASKTMTVNSASSIISGSSQLCVNSTTTYLPPLPGGTWSSSNPAVISISAATGVASGMGFGTATISYTLGTTFYTKNVTVSNTIPAITGSLVACHGLTSVLSHSIEGGIWSSGSPWHATINSANGTVMAVTPGVSLISYTLGTDCHAISVFTVTPLPGAISGSLEICQGNSLALYSSTFSGTWVSTTASVATIGSATGIATGISTGTTSITYTGPNGCITTAIVTVNAAIGSITGTPSVCIGGTNSTLVSPVSGGTWSSSNVGIANINATTGLLTGVGVGNANISYTTTPGCYAVIVATVNILDTITGANNVCNGATIALANGTGGGAWSSSNVSKATVGAATGIVTGISPGSAIITYTLGSCYRTRTVSVTPAPAAITGTTTLCIGTSATLSSATSGGVWSSSDITKATVNSTTGLTTGIATGTAVISYTAGGCSSTVIVTVGTLAAISGSASVCVGSTTTLTHVTTGGVWSSSNTSRATIGAGTGIATGVSAGTVRISYTVGGACSQTIIVTVNALPNNITGNAAVCEGAITTLATTTAAGTWSSSMPAIATVGTNGVVTGVTAGTTTISYQLSTGCVNSRVVTVNMTPDIITGTTSVCIGSTTTLASATGGGVWASYFTSRATINAATGVATGISAGTTIISYTLGTCRRTTVLTVAPTPAAITGILIICNGSNTALSSATTGGVWSSSDVTKATINAATGLVTGVGTGTSIISYIVGGCSRSAIVTVNASIGAISGDGLVCVGQTNATLTGPGGSGTWSSSNTAVATAHAVTGLLTGVSPGTATITYTSSATCVATIVATVNAAVNNITGTLAICDGTSTTLSNATADGTWSSSNTTTASVNAATGLVSGVSAGTTTISYRVSAGCYKATTFYINPLPPNINGSATVVIGGSTTFTSMTGGTWTSNNAAIATVGAGTGVVSGISLGATTITYSLATGCFRTKGISVVPARPDNNNYTTIETTAILKIYPNPTSGILTIEAPSNGTFAVYAIDGKHLADYQINIPSSIVTLPRELAAGVYMCRYTAADGSTTIVRIVYEP